MVVATTWMVLLALCCGSAEPVQFTAMTFNLFYGGQVDDSTTNTTQHDC
jgi:hypothetical protein